MNKYKTLSNFKIEWVLKVIPYDIKYRKAYDITNFDSILCTIVHEKGGSIDKNELAFLLGFNVESNKTLKIYADLAEKEIFDFFLKKVLDFDLLEIRGEFVWITEAGISSLISKIKYEYFSARVGLFQNFSATENEETLFSFKDSYGFDNPIFWRTKISGLDVGEDSLIKRKLDLQLFDNDVKRGEILEIKTSDKTESYQEFEIDTSFYCNYQGVPDIHFKHFLESCFDIDEILKESANEGLRKRLITKGEFYSYLNENSPIDSNIILRYLDLWDWKKLAVNTNVIWSDIKIFHLFCDNGERSSWEVLSQNIEIEKIIPVLAEFEDFWIWAILTERFDNLFIKENFNVFPWDVEILSHKDQDFVLELLSDNNLEKELWDWQYLSDILPANFIIETINQYPWDFYKITNSRFEIFKEVFNEAFSKGTQELFSKPWDWKYISKEINLDVLYKHLQLFAPYIDWEITLFRFFNNSAISTNCLKSVTFKMLLQDFLPDSYVIKDQSYLWNPSLLIFFDDLGLIHWDTYSYIDGFDQNKSVKWDIDTFSKFHGKIGTSIGYTTVSAQITNGELLLQYPEFNWDWSAISQNENVINVEFISDILEGKHSIAGNLIWDLIYKKFPISFWNKKLTGIKKFISYEENLNFFNTLTSEQDISFILLNRDIKWDWKLLSQEIEMTKVLETLGDPYIKIKWDWSILTPRFKKTQVYEYLENCKSLWDWTYLILNVFEYDKDLKLEDGGLERIAKCLADIDDERKTEIWNLITNFYPIGTLFQYIQETKGNFLYQWNWTSISGNRHLKTDLVTLNSLKKQLNWIELSSNPAINKKFDPIEWDSFPEYIENTVKYLKFFSENWNWEILSRNESLNWNRIILDKFQDQLWDWDYLSEFGKFLTKGSKDKEKYLNKLFKQFPKINFELVSKRSDIEINSEIILENEGLKWDWEELSNNPSVKLSSNLLLQLHHKNWDWKSLSNRRDIIISNKMLIQLKSKDWDWKKISTSPELIFDHDFITELIDKPWDWGKITIHASFIPTQNLLPKIKKFDLDWKHISKHPDLQINREVLLNFGNKLDWHSVTRHKNLPINEAKLIAEFKEQWDWNYLCAASDFPLDDSALQIFAKFLNWEALSSNTNIQFTRATLLKFEKFWNWNQLANNNKIKDLLGDFVDKKISASHKLKFLSNLDRQSSEWKNSVYHFTHIENAIEIITNKKIFSRKNAIIRGDAAGNVVHLRDDAHEYARFYFRPHTPTQFYNEFLGKSVSDGYSNKKGEWISWYEKSRGLGFPKCPIPIFFKFDLKEIIYDERAESCISNGNMQSKSTKFGSIEKMIKTFGYEDLFYTPEKYATKEDYRKYREFSQQEFLVKNELNFSSYENYQIVCASNLDSCLLKKMLGSENEEIFEKILVDPEYYNFQNPRVDIKIEENSISVNSDLLVSGNFYITSKTGFNSTQVREGDIQKISPKNIIFKSNLVLDNLKDDFTLKFIDESSREWILYTHSVGSYSRERNSKKMIEII